MVWEDFLSVIKEGESYTSKFFPSIESEDHLGPTLTAMANTKGGDIIIGFDIKNYHLRGTTLTRQWLNNLINSYCSPKPEIDIKFLEKNENSVAIISILNTEKKPYYYKNKCYVLNLDKTNLSIMEKNNVNDFIFNKDSDNTSNINEEEESINYKQEDLDKITDELEFLTTKESSPSSEKKELEKEDVKQEKVINSNNTDYPIVTPEHNLNTRQQKALAHIAQHSSIKNKAYRELFNVSHKTAHLELVDLVDKKLISSQGLGRSTCYVLNTQEQQSFI